MTVLRKWLSICFFLALAAAVSPLPARATTSIALASSMAAAGDSITRGFDANGSCLLRDCPQLSWSTGTDSSVNSHYSRLLLLNPALSGHQYNIAKTGAKMSDLPGQLVAAGYYRIDYVTVLMGANDLCTSSAATMTPTRTFAVQFYTALAYYFYYNPDGHVFVSSIPDIYQLWTVFHTNSTATRAWNLFHICQSMLAASNTDADRQKVVDQERADNYALGYVCTTYFVNCRWDNNTTFNFKFPASDVSTIDYFHPNPNGQADLADTTWLASYWGS
jgi:lysophospholipase L1-like esterase